MLTEPAKTMLRTRLVAAALSSREFVDAWLDTWNSQALLATEEDAAYWGFPSNWEWRTRQVLSTRANHETYPSEAVWRAWTPAERVRELAADHNQVGGYAQASYWSA